VVLEIIILEDWQHKLTWISNFIKRYTEFEELDTNIKLVTNDVQEIKKIVQLCTDQNVLLFLDVGSIENDHNIVELGKYIRHCLPLASLVFITEKDNLSTLILEQRLVPLDCIYKIKPVDVIEEAIRQDINVALELVVSHMKSNPEKFVYKLRARYYDIPMSEVLYIASKPNHVNRVVLYAKNIIVEINDSLSSIEKRHQNFFRSHKGFVINLMSVNYFDIRLNRVYFDDENQIWCPLSVRKKQNFKKVWQRINHVN
jgi:two-component system response regulator AgrA